jgi:hypothetical protein
VEGAIVLVSFDDDDVAFPRFRVRAEVAKDAADDHGRIEAGFFENRGDHRRGGGLAVRTGNSDAALLVDEGSKKILAPDDLDASLARRLNLGVRTFDGGGDDDGIGAVEMGGVVADAHIDAARRNEPGGRRVLEIASGHGHPAAGQDLGDTTHSNSADADEMNVLNLV